MLGEKQQSPNGEISGREHSTGAWGLPILSWAVHMSSWTKPSHKIMVCEGLGKAMQGDYLCLSQHRWWDTRKFNVKLDLELAVALSVSNCLKIPILRH